MTTSVHRTHPPKQPSIGRVFLSAVLALVLLCALVSAVSAEAPCCSWPAASTWRRSSYTTPEQAEEGSRPAAAPATCASAVPHRV